MRIQDAVIALRCLLINHKGIYPENYKTTPVPNGQTYCNHAAYLTVLALDNKFANFTGKPNGAFPEPPDANTYGYRNSNYWCDFLREQAGKGILVECTGTATEKEAKAQEKANEGYVVIAAWKNTKPKAEGGGSPHFATVRPGFEANSVFGAKIANVGGTNNVMWRSEGFPGIQTDEIHWYYNPNQDFQYKPDIIQKYTDFE
jgi:hypothetical protein